MDIGSIDASKEKKTTFRTETIIQQSLAHFEQTLLEQIKNSDKSDEDKDKCKSKVLGFLHDNILGPFIREAMGDVARTLMETLPKTLMQGTLNPTVNKRRTLISRPAQRGGLLPAG